MTKHVHEWAIHITGKVHCEECGVVLKPTKADAMLNATERLSAGVAETIKIFMQINSIEDYGYSYNCLCAYANILEGKDENE